VVNCVQSKKFPASYKIFALPTCLLASEAEFFTISVIGDGFLLRCTARATARPDCPRSLEVQPM